MNFLKESLKDSFKFWIKATYVFVLVIITIAVSLAIINRNESVDARPVYEVESTVIKEVKPDKASVVIGTQIEGTDVLEIQEEANEAINNAIEKIKELGIDESNIQTSNYNVRPVYDWRDEDESVDEYSTDINITISVDELGEDAKILGDIIAVAAETKLNEVRNFQYEISNRDEIIEELKIEAVNDAKSKKERLSEETGFKLGDIKNISYNSPSRAPRYDYGYIEELSVQEDASAPDVNVYVGQNELRVVAYVTFEILN